jgi:hypothetical protein
VKAPENGVVYRVPQTETDESREYRIEMEIVVDAYGEEERAMGWYCYLQDKLTFPFWPGASPGG